MSAAAAQAPFPRLQLAAVGIVLGSVLLGSAAARFTSFGAPAAPPPVIAAVSLSFNDLPDGGIAVREAGTDRLVSTIAPRDGGFLRSTMRVLATERGRENIGPEKPFALSELQGGRLLLTDTATGQVLDLEAFGPTNEAEFSKILFAAEQHS
jgi:putative photosynthetic complex assembly protein